MLEIQSGGAALYGAAVVLCTAGFVGSTNASVIFDFEGFANGRELGTGANAIQPYASFFTLSAFSSGSPSLGAAPPPALLVLDLVLGVDDVVATARGRPRVGGCTGGRVTAADL